MKKGTFGTLGRHVLLAVLVLHFLAAGASAKDPAKLYTTSRSVSSSPRYYRLPMRIPVRKNIISEINVSGNIVSIRDNSEANEVLVTADGIQTTYISADLKKINVALRGDNNSFSFVVGGVTDELIHQRQVNVEGGALFDTISINLFTRMGAGGPVTVESQTTFNIDSSSGRDSIEAIVRHVGSGGSLTFNVDMGDQADAFNFSGEGVVDGTLWVDVNGGSSEADNFRGFHGLPDFGDAVVDRPNIEQGPDGPIVSPGGTSGTEATLGDWLYLDLETLNVGPSGYLNVNANGGHDHDTVQCYLRGRIEGIANVTLHGDQADAVDPIFWDDETELGMSYKEIAGRMADTVVLDVVTDYGSTGLVMANAIGGMGSDRVVLQALQGSGSNANVIATLDGGSEYDWYYATGKDDLPGEYVIVKNAESFDPSLRVD
jgi:hypothetical protein